MSGETILMVDKLRKSFGGVMALHDVDFELRQGDFLGIIGTEILFCHAAPVEKASDPCLPGKSPQFPV